jgi:hypothetical protein
MAQYIKIWEGGTVEFWNSEEWVGVEHVTQEEGESDSASSCYMLFRNRDFLRTVIFCNRVFLRTAIFCNSSNTATVPK